MDGYCTVELWLPAHGRKSDNALRHIHIDTSLKHCGLFTKQRDGTDVVGCVSSDLLICAHKALGFIVFATDL